MGTEGSLSFSKQNAYWPCHKPDGPISKVCGRCCRYLAAIAGSNPAGAWMSVVLPVVCCQVEVSATGRLSFKRSPTACDVSESDLEASITRRSWPTRRCRGI